MGGELRSCSTFRLLLKNGKRPAHNAVGYAILFKTLKAALALPIHFSFHDFDQPLQHNLVRGLCPPMPPFSSFTILSILLGPCASILIHDQQHVRDAPTAPNPFIFQYQVLEQFSMSQRSHQLTLLDKSLLPCSNR
jgi:hypothetical protein